MPRRAGSSQRGRDRDPRLTAVGVGIQVHTSASRGSSRIAGQSHVVAVGVNPPPVSLQSAGRWPTIRHMFGVALPGRGPLAKPDLILKIAERAESLRFTSVFVTDHVVLPVSAATSIYPYSPTGQFPGGMEQDYLEPLTLMSHLARATRRVRLGTSVLVIPYRNPVVTAKMLATIDVLSGGRVILGAGVGWLQEEFDALAAPPFAERGRVTNEYLQIMRACWTKAPVSFHGRYYSLREVYALPRPSQAGGIP